MALNSGYSGHFGRVVGGSVWGLRFRGLRRLGVQFRGFVQGQVVYWVVWGCFEPSFVSFLLTGDGVFEHTGGLNKWNRIWHATPRL